MSVFWQIILSLLSPLVYTTSLGLIPNFASNGLTSERNAPVAITTCLLIENLIATLAVPMLSIPMFASPGLWQP